MWISGSVSSFGGLYKLTHPSHTNVCKPSSIQPLFWKYYRQLQNLFADGKLHHNLVCWSNKIFQQEGCNNGSFVEQNYKLCSTDQCLVLHLPTVQHCSAMGLALAACASRSLLGLRWVNERADQRNGASCEANKYFEWFFVGYRQRQDNQKWQQQSLWEIYRDRIQQGAPYCGC